MRGELRHGLPVGFVWSEADGEIRFHPDEAVVTAIHTIFQRFANRIGAPCLDVVLRSKPRVPPQIHARTEIRGVDAPTTLSTIDWLIEQQPRIEAALAKKHLVDGALVFYNVSSSYMEGRCCPLATYGYSQDHRSDPI